VRLARFYATAKPGDAVPIESISSQQFVWGNFVVTGGLMLPGANAWADNIVWGTSQTGDGDNIVWGTAATRKSNIVWGTADGDNIVWGTASCEGDNIVWGTLCGGADCDNIVWGTSDGDNVVWGTALEGDNIVWGTSADGDNIVWGTSADADVTWGSSSDDATLYSDDDSEPLPSIDLEFGDLVPLMPNASPTTVGGGL